MNSVEQMKAALGEPLKRTLGGTEMEFLPLPVTDLPEFYEIAQEMKGGADSISKVAMEKIVKLIVKMVKQTTDAPDDIIAKFCMKHFYELQEILTELHMPDATDVKKNERLNSIRERFKKNEAVVTGQDKEQSQQ